MHRLCCKRSFGLLAEVQVSAAAESVGPGGAIGGEAEGARLVIAATFEDGGRLQIEHIEAGGAVVLPVPATRNCPSGVKAKP